MLKTGQVEADETFIGPNPKFMHRRRLEKRRAGRTDGYVDKTIVARLLERPKKGTKGKSRVHAEVVPTTQAYDLVPPVKDNVTPGSEMITDANRSDWGVRDQYIHSVIDHTQAYVKGHVHTNGIENFWSLLKRMIHGTYVGVSSFHLGAYMDEEVFRFNERGDHDGGRFGRVLRNVTGCRITYERLINGPALA